MNAVRVCVHCVWTGQRWRARRLSKHCDLMSRYTVRTLARIVGLRKPRLSVDLCRVNGGASQHGHERGNLHRNRM